MEGQIEDEQESSMEVQVRLSPTIFEQLSAAEREIVREICAGHDSASIARRRGVAVRTIANQLAVLFRKLGVGSRRELIVALVNRESA